MKVREKVCRNCSALTFLDDTECKTCGQSFGQTFAQRFDANARAIPSGPVSGKWPGLRFVVPALLVVGAVWFGLRLGPQQKEQRPASPLAATLAAQGFVRSAVAKRSADVTFPQNGTSAEPYVAEPNLWIVTGTASAGTTAGTAAGTAALQWTVTERWDGVHNWRLKAVEVVGPKQSLEAMHSEHSVTAEPLP